MKLFPYQQKIVDEQYKDSIALFMDMGTGKTYVSMGMFQKSKCSKLLVVCLATKVDDWQRDVSNELGLKTTSLNKGTKRNRKILKEENDALVISFESSWRLKELLDWVDNDTYIIIDESHKLKNHKSKVGKFARKLGDKTKYKSILTGTPQSRGYVDYYNQFRFLGITDMSYKEFEDRYCEIALIKWSGFPVKEIVGYKNTDELDSLINDNAIYYERDINDEFIPSEMTVKFKKIRKYNQIKKDRVYEDKSGEMHLFDTTGSLMHATRQLASGYLKGDNLNDSKIKWVKDFVESYDGRIVIFYNYNRELEMLEDALKDEPYSIYNGSIKDLTRFKEDAQGIALVNYGSGSTGINELVISNVEIHYSVTTSYIDFVQAKKRIDRIGQTKKPLYYYLVMENTIDSKILESLKKGLDFDEKMFEKYMEAK